MALAVRQVRFWWSRSWLNSVMVMVFGIARSKIPPSQRGRHQEEEIASGGDRNGLRCRPLAFASDDSRRVWSPRFTRLYRHRMIAGGFFHSRHLAEEGCSCSRPDTRQKRTARHFVGSLLPCYARGHKKASAMVQIAEAFSAGNPTRNLTESVFLNGLDHRFDFSVVNFPTGSARKILRN